MHLLVSGTWGLHSLGWASWDPNNAIQLEGSGRALNHIAYGLLQVKFVPGPCRVVQSRTSYFWAKQTMFFFHA